MVISPDRSGANVTGSGIGVPGKHLLFLAERDRTVERFFLPCGATFN